MSTLRISSIYSEDINLNVLNFTAPIAQNIPSVQTKTKMLHFPYKANQPQVRFQVSFRNENDYEAFQNFVRRHHLAAIGGTDDASRVTLWWPERGIRNWSGYIRDFLAGGEKFNFSPRAEFVVELCDSFISSRTTQYSFGSPFSNIFGQQISLLRSDWWKLPDRPSTQSPEPNPNIPPTTPLPTSTPGGGGGSF